MNNEYPPIRIFGQRSITSSFLSRSSNPFKKSDEDAKRKSSKSSHYLSLSEFLNRKLPEASVRQRTVKGKSRPFSTLQGPRDSNGSINEHTGTYCEADSQTDSAIAKVIFEQFKRSELNQGEFSISGCGSEADISIEDDMQESRKRKKTIEGFSIPCNLFSLQLSAQFFAKLWKYRLRLVDDFLVEFCLSGSVGQSQTVRKKVLVLGGDPKPVHKGKKAIHIRNKNLRPLYNHYANGGGWWDCDMEGIDNEEVGIGEVWEGVGSTTLGGIEWH